MANYTTTITNEGAALLASVIANQGTLTFNEFRFSENDYTGQESTLTEGTFLGVFITAGAAASVIDSTTIKASAQFNNSTITGNHDLYSIGIIGTDGNTTALIAVCTTTDPDVIREPLTGTSTYAFNVNLTVSDTSQINVFGTTAAILYDIDVVDTLISTATNKPLSANQGRLIGDNLAANENVYGAKNTWDYTRFVTGNGGFTQNSGVYTNTLTDTRPSFHLIAKAFDSNFTDLGLGSVINEIITGTGIKELPASIPNNTAYLRIAHNGLGQDFTFYQPITQTGDVILSFDVTSNDPTTVGGLSFTDVMLRDARITDPTFAPYAETNLQLTRKTSGLSNRNLLDNPWFTVNQRGATTITNGYGADRWEDASGTTVTFGSGGVTFGGTAAQIEQPLESILPNGTYTASVLLSDGTIISGTATKTSDSANTIFYNTASLTLFYRYTVQAFAIYSGSAKTIRAVKLEVGTVSTLHLDLAPDYTTELLKCQRYFYRANQAAATALFAIVMGFSATVAYAPFRTPVPMRATPNISFGGTFNLVNASDTNVVATISLSTYTGDLGTISIGSSNLTPSNMYMLMCGLANSYIDFSADL